MAHRQTDARVVEVRTFVDTQGASYQNNERDVVFIPIELCANF